MDYHKLLKIEIAGRKLIDQTVNERRRITITKLVDIVSDIRRDFKRKKQDRLFEERTFTKQEIINALKKTFSQDWDVFANIKVDENHEIIEDFFNNLK